MNRILALVTCVLLFIAVSAQKRTTVGFRGGYNLYTIHGRNADGSNFWLKTEDGFNIAINVEFPISRNIYMQPGITYNQKGANFSDYHYMGQTYHGDVKLSYVEIPVTIVFKPKMGSGHLMVGAGAYTGYGTGHEAGVDQGMYHIRFKEDVSSEEVAEMPFYFRPWDAGANFLLGYQFANNLFAQLNGQVGMKRINPSVDGQWDGKMKHRTIGFGMSIGYRF